MQNPPKLLGRCRSRDFSRITNSSDRCSVCCGLHCVKSVCIRSFSGAYFAAFGLNREIYRVNFRIQWECWKKTDQKNSEYGHFLHSFSECTGLVNCFAWTNFTVQTLLWSLELMIFRKSRARHHSRLKISSKLKYLI